MRHGASNLAIYCCSYDNTPIPQSLIEFSVGGAETLARMQRAELMDTCEKCRMTVAEKNLFEGKCGHRFHLNCVKKHIKSTLEE
jgi:hypothetical protein